MNCPECGNGMVHSSAGWLCAECGHVQPANSNSGSSQSSTPPASPTNVGVTDTQNHQASQSTPSEIGISQSSQPQQFNQVSANEWPQKLGAHWKRTTAVLTSLSVGLIALTLILSVSYSISCSSGGFCGLAALPFIWGAYFVSILIVIIGLRRYVIHKWPQTLIVTFGAILLAYSFQSIIPDSLYGLSATSGSVYIVVAEILSVWIILYFSLLALIKLSVSTARHLRVYMIIGVIGISALGQVASSIVGNKAETSNNANIIKQTGIQPYMASYTPGFSIDYLSPFDNLEYHYSNPGDDSYEILNFKGGSSQLNAANCNKFNPNANVEDASWSACTSVETLDHSPVYFSEYAPVGPPYSPHESAYFVQLGPTVITLTDFAGSQNGDTHEVLSRPAALKIINSLHPVSITEAAKLPE